MPINDYFASATWRSPDFLRNAATCFFIVAAVPAVAALRFHFAGENRGAIVDAVVICFAGWTLCLELIPTYGSKLGVYAIMGRNAGELTAMAAGGSLLLYQILRSKMFRHARGFPVLKQSDDQRVKK